MYYLFGICLALSFFFVFNFFGSLFASVLWRVVAEFIDNKPARNRAKIIFAFRVLPPVIALVFVFVFFIPSFVLFEPVSPQEEVVTFKLIAVALTGLFGFGLAFYRLCAGWLTTRRLVKNWTARTEVIQVSGVSIPVFRINHQFPVIAVVGTLRPRMFIASHVFDLLDDEELAAAVAHEYGHLTALDNLKSVILRFCRDLLVVAPFNRRLEKAWARTSELAADEYAAKRGGKQTALNLAGALVKIARVVPRGAKPAMPVGAFLIEQPTADVTGRVSRLLQPANGNFTAENTFLNLQISLWIYLFALGGVTLLLATNLEVQHKIHLAYESVVAVLQ